MADAAPAHPAVVQRGGTQDSHVSTSIMKFTLGLHEARSTTMILAVPFVTTSTLEFIFLSLHMHIVLTIFYDKQVKSSTRS